MFGWEFPPDISGGLGVACEGLVSALAGDQTRIVLVIPKLTGREIQNGCHLLDASSVESNINDPPQRRQWITTQKTEQVESWTSTVEVPAQLSPYNLAHHTTANHILQHWNHHILVEPEAIALAEDNNHTQRTKGSKYTFIGGYGPQLLDEVDRYAGVAVEIANRNEFDIIHTHDWMTIPAGIAVKRAHSKPFVVHVHATEFDRAGKDGSPAVYAIEREGFESADKIICVSQWTASVLVNNYQVDPRKIVVVHNGIDVARWHPLDKQSHPVGKQIITFLGRVTFQKGPEYFVDVAEKVLQKFPDCHFVMAGSGDALPRMISRVAARKLSRNFHFTGFLQQDDVQRLLSMTSVYVMPSVSEPFGLTALEAGHAGVPVVISKQAGVGEVMLYAIKVDFWDLDKMTDAICHILRSDNFSNALTKRSKRSIDALSWHTAAEKIRNIYNELM